VRIGRLLIPSPAPPTKGGESPPRFWRTTSFLAILPFPAINSLFRTTRLFYIQVREKVRGVVGPARMALGSGLCRMTSVTFEISRNSGDATPAESGWVLLSNRQHVHSM